MEHVSFQVRRGTIFAILGGSGSGKSTLLRYLIGLEWPQAGRIEIDGIGEPHRYEGVPPFGVLFQSGALFSSMTLAENVALPLTRWTPISGATARQLVQAKLDVVGLGSFADHLPGEISGGMKKRAGIARALILEPDLLFFDEPSAGLDPISAVELDELILTLSRDLGITIVMVTHELPSIFLVANHCIVLDKAAKGVVAEGDPRKLRDESKISFVHNFFTRSVPDASVLSGRRVSDAAPHKDQRDSSESGVLRSSHLASGMARADMRNLMRHHSGQLGFLVRCQDSSRIDVDESAGERERVDHVGVNDLKGEGYLCVGVTHQILSDAVHIFGNHGISDEF